MQSEDQLCIPVLYTSEVVVVPFDQLPSDAEEVLEVLTSEAAPLRIWFDFAKAYLAKNQLDNFQHILNEGTSPEVEQECEKFFGEKPKYEKVQFFCAMAALELAKAQEEKDKRKKDDFLTAANRYLVQARESDPDQQLHHLGSAILALAKGGPQAFEAAMREFQMATRKKNQGRPSVAGELAVAALHYRKGNYRDALDMYKRVLRKFPSGPPEMRMGLGACYYQLGDMKMAEAAFQRVVQLDPDCVEGLLALATIKFNNSNVQQGLADGLKLLVRAYDVDPLHPGVLTLLAQLMLLRGQADKVLVMATTALEVAESDEQKALCYMLLGRGYHSQGDMQKAYFNYGQASRLSPSLPLPHIGLAQYFLANNTVNNAVTELEAVLEHTPDSHDALKLLGKLHTQLPARVQKNLSRFKEAVSRRSDDIELWETLGEMLSTSDPAGALQAYEKALNLHRQKQKESRERIERIQRRLEQRGQSHGFMGGDLFDDDEEEEGGRLEDGNVEEHRIPARLLNNTAVLVYRSGRIVEALDLMGEALKQMQEDGDKAQALHLVTLGYNIARLKEASGELSQAQEGYKKLLQEFPDYIDCYLRLACIARNTSNINGALQMVQQALQKETNHPDALALQGLLWTEIKDYHNAEAALKSLAKDGPVRHDPYGLLGLANVHLRLSLGEERRKDAKTLTAEEVNKKNAENLSKAKDNYMYCLQHDPHNIYAANGLGTILAESDRLEEAKEVFMLVQAAAAASRGFLRLPDVYINLANIYLAQKDFVSAIKMYKKASTEFYHNRNAKVLLYLARAYYDQGELQSARQVLLKAIHVAPTDIQLHFNIAVTLQEQAVRVYQRKRMPGDAKKREEFEEGQLQLDRALKIFQHLRAVEDERSRSTKLSATRLDRHIDFCRVTLTKAEKYVKTAIEEEELTEQKKATLEAVKREAQAKKEREKREEEERKRQEEDRRQETARRAQEDLARMKEAWRATEPPGFEGEGHKKRKKRKKNAAEEFADFMVDGDDDVPGTQELPADEEEYQEALDRAGLGSDQEEEPARGGGAKKPGRGGRLKKRRASSVSDGGDGREEDELEDLDETVGGSRFPQQPDMAGSNGAGGGGNQEGDDMDELFDDD